MMTWKILFLWILPCYRAGDDGMFECGTHGRFEYCIDGIPGCVVGCHCHPGYYFDTETKICEPNTKLTQNYRRNYLPEPTRVQSPMLFSDNPSTETLPTLTTHNIIEQHVNDITKNADDLSDWLYNQFFKTIENQVINNTNKDGQLTRRSGRGSLTKRNKLKRRTRRKGNKHKKKKKGIQGKLLRIAEDDSLFQSSDSSDSDSSHSSYSQSSSSFESNSDEDHGHKKILLINKKPRPPLPSFIFFPNMNTPYYPPIGLPPPPIMPMYPMVPVPPMMPAPPLIPFPGHVPECAENITNGTSEPTTVSTTTVKTVTINTEEKPTKTESVTTTTQLETEKTSAPALRNNHRGRKRKKLKSLENIEDENEESQLDFYESTQGGRQKLINLLRQKMNNPKIKEPSIKRYKKPFDNYSNQFLSPEILMDNDIMNDVVPENRNTSPPNFADNVDFKYLSQLIHRVNENQTQDDPTHMDNPNEYPKMNLEREGPINRYHDLNVPLKPSRRINVYANSSRNGPTDDSYYSKLGRQIATLIRTIDADKERQFNIEIENVQQKPNVVHPYFNENGPRTFWERFVRSPLKYFHSFQTRFDDLKNSNELLFNIENKVETVASTVPTLSLQELENMINVMQTVRTELQRKKIKNTQPSRNMLNVNLWPQEVRQIRKTIKTSNRPNDFDVKTRKGIHYSDGLRPEILNTYKVKQNPLTNRTKFNQLNDISSKHVVQLPSPVRNITKMYSQPKYQVQNPRTLYSSEKRRRTIKPTILNYKNIKKYFFDQSNQYSFQNDNIRLHYPPASRASQRHINTLIASPYFHHEISHVDFIT